MIDVRFEIGPVDDTVKQKVTQSHVWSAMFDKVSIHDAAVPPILLASDASISGLAESYGLKGHWAITLTGHGDINENWKGFSAHYNAHVNVQDNDSTFVYINASGLSADAVIDAVATLSELIDIEGNAAWASIVSSAGVPMEIYYRPPLAFYDDFTLGDMDNDILAQLERRLIE